MSVTIPHDGPRLLTTKQLSNRISVCVGTLERWRREGKGPKSVKLPGKLQADIRYKIEHVVEWENSLELTETFAIAQNVEAALGSVQAG
jgi:hypothetical protein